MSSCSTAVAELQAGIFQIRGFGGSPEIFYQKSQENWYVSGCAKNSKSMNKVEEYKSEKDGLDILQDVPRYAKEGWEKITDDDKERLKWAGVFFRRRTPGRFMMR